MAALIGSPIHLSITASEGMSAPISIAKKDKQTWSNGIPTGPKLPQHGLLPHRGRSSYCSHKEFEMCSTWTETKQEKRIWNLTWERWRKQMHRNSPVPRLLINTCLIGTRKGFVLNQVFSRVFCRHQWNTYPELKEKDAVEWRFGNLRSKGHPVSYIWGVVSRVDVAQQQAGQIGIVRARQRDHEDRETQVCWEVQLLCQSLWKIITK